MNHVVAKPLEWRGRSQQYVVAEKHRSIPQLRIERDQTAVLGTLYSHQESDEDTAR
jgi:hypothetical protein